MNLGWCCSPRILGKFWLAYNCRPKRAIGRQKSWDFPNRNYNFKSTNAVIRWAIYRQNILLSCANNYFSMNSYFYGAFMGRLWAGGVQTFHMVPSALNKIFYSILLQHYYITLSIRCNSFEWMVKANRLSLRLGTHIQSLHEICENTDFHWPVFSHGLLQENTG